MTGIGFGEFTLNSSNKITVHIPLILVSYIYFFSVACFLSGATCAFIDSTAGLVLPVLLG